MNELGNLALFAKHQAPLASKRLHFNFLRHLGAMWNQAGIFTFDINNQNSPSNFINYVRLQISANAALNQQIEAEIGSLKMRSFSEHRGYNPL
ncbi:MAG: hypothetical protein CMP14_06085 [Rickettsiales bacterium]|nr:hypothetical protein [Rickettsiales bacterium]